MPRVTTSKPQTISYPAPGARPYRREDIAVDPHVVVLFGATGDLARRKLIPGLAYLDQSELAPNIEIVATSLEDLTTEDFLKLAKEATPRPGLRPAAVALRAAQTNGLPLAWTAVPRSLRRFRWWPRPM